MSETLKSLRTNLGWSLSELAVRAKIDVSGVIKAEKGIAVRARTAKRIVEALSEGYGKEIRVTDVEGLITL